jgi:hypothetical protein
MNSIGTIAKASIVPPAGDIGRLDQPFQTQILNLFPT